MEAAFFHAPRLILQPSLFKSFFQGGFECSTHRRYDGKRLDLINSTLHDKFVHEDYLALANCEIKTVRDGVRWHLIESSPGKYDWSNFLPMLKAAEKSGTQVIWDLCHYGWPDDIDIWKPEFVKKFANFAKEVATLVKNETDTIPFYTPINEISFWSWAGGDVAYLNPAITGRGFELKHQLVSATIDAIDAIRLVDVRARFVQAEPLINVINVADPLCSKAKDYTESQYQVCDMLAGRLWPGLGGSNEYLDIIGVNYYPYNQWALDGRRIMHGHSLHKPLSEMLCTTYNRYQRPLFIAETGTEGDQRREWFLHICKEVDIAVDQGVPIEGVCLYPITNYLGWDDDRLCPTGLLGPINIFNHRGVFTPLAEEIKIQMHRFKI